jgi:hypothetical protein
MGVVYACAFSFMSKYLYQSCGPKPMTRVDINDNNQSSNNWEFFSCSFTLIVFGKFRDNPNHGISKTKINKKGGTLTQQKHYPCRKYEHLIRIFTTPKVSSQNLSSFTTLDAILQLSRHCLEWHR